MMKDDNELVYEVIHGSISSFEVLIDRYQQTIFNIILRMVGDFETARDLTQDVFVKAFEKMGGFNFKYRFFSWIYRMAINEAINYNRKRPKNISLNGIDPLLAENPEASDHESSNRLLHNGLLNLTDDYRVLVLLKYYCGFSYEEINEVTRIPVKKVRSRLFIAREQLRKGLIANGFFENDR
ncbi:MAG: sigma-70 family RNA polymerase sigma factor [Bacteroidales bacterium]|nr:sigma-70 family RNA polymerase sigma factor [Bacteroidales bacterium]